MTRPPSRRGFLRRCAALGLGAGLAGCIASEADPSADPSVSAGGASEETPDPTATTDGAATPSVETRFLTPAAAADGAVYVGVAQEGDPRERTEFAVGVDGAIRWAFESDAGLTDLAAGGRRAFVDGSDGFVYALDGEAATAGPRRRPRRATRP